VWFVVVVVVVWVNLARIIPVAAAWLFVEEGPCPRETLTGLGSMAILLSVCLSVCVWLSEWRLLDSLFLHTISRHFLNTRLPTHDSTPFPDLELFPSRLPHTLKPFPDDHFLILQFHAIQFPFRGGSQALVRPRPSEAPRAPRERLEGPVRYANHLS